MEEIDEMLHQLPRESPRSLRSIFLRIGSGIANVFGLSTHKDMQRIQTLLTRVLDGRNAASNPLMEKWPKSLHWGDQTIEC